MPHQITVTGKTGPNISVAGMVLQNVLRIDFALDDERITVYQANQAGNQIKEFDTTGMTVLTCAIVNGQFAFVVS